MEKKDWYEIRQYDDYIVAEVEVNWDQGTALNSGFRYLAWYIFGWNTSQKSISMTSPVNDIKSEKIAMTSPVNDIKSWDTHIVQFILPGEYTLETLPLPNNDKVKLREVEWYKAAALTYRLWATEEKVKTMKQKLNNYLQRDSIEITGEVISAQYNPPASFPLTRRNEIIVEIK